MTQAHQIRQGLAGLIDLIGILDTTRLTRFQKDTIRAEYLLDMGFDGVEDSS